jgi:hypothetical protein
MTTCVKRPSLSGIAEIVATTCSPCLAMVNTTTAGMQEVMCHHDTSSNRLSGVQIFGIIAGSSFLCWYLG